MMAELLAPFRRRLDEVATSADDLGLCDLLSWARPSDETEQALRQSQLQALIRLAPATITVQLIAAAIVCTTLRTYVPAWELLVWLAASAFVCLSRGTRAWRLRTDPDYARRHPPELLPIVIVIAALAMLWLVPPLLWFPGVDSRTQLLLCLLTVGLMSAGSVTVASVPQASLTYMGILGIGLLVMAAQLGSVPQLVLTLLYLTVLCWAVLANARQFVFNVRTRLELQEQGELIALLREFEASGTDWLWELDKRQRLTRVSSSLAAALGKSPAELVGRGAMEVLDPDGRSLRLSAGMQSLFEHANAGTPFRDVAVPMFGGRRWWTLSGKPLLDDAGRLVGWRGVGSDITDARLSGSDAVRAARRDPLTGLANRLLVREQLEQSLLRQAAGGEGCALLLVDLDRFKLVNDTMGHGVGDQLLCEVARRLHQVAGSSSCVGRLGGDEFALVWTGECGRSALSDLAGRLCRELQRSVAVGASSLHVGATIGIAIGGRDGSTEGELMRAADLALYSAKKAERGSHAFFEPAMRQRAEDHRQLENDIRDALAGDALHLVFQPIVDANSGQLLVREALLRWRHPVRGEIMPDQFVGLIEDIGLMHQIGAWVLRMALEQAAAWPEEIAVAVNVSGTQLSAPGFTQLVVNTLAATGIAPGRVQLEVTEGIFLGDDPATFAALETLRRLGVQLVLDDFGTGYCSFGYLRRARFAKLKIDQSFVRSAARGDGDGRAIVEAVVALAGSLDLRITAEGVESDEEAALMRQLGCDELQGFLYGRPAALGPPPDGLEASRRRSA